MKSNLRLRDSSPSRITAVISDAFRPIRFDGRQPICTEKAKNHSKISRCEVRSSFSGADFWRDKANGAENTCVLSRRLTQYRRKSVRKNRLGLESHNLILIGMPGSGKSTCGVVAAKMLLKNFFDTDLLIQNIEGISLQNIIDTKGNDYFEMAEEKAILDLDIQGTVIATGGSVVYSDKAMEHLKTLGKIIYLHLDYEHMCRRISNLSTRGVLMKKGETLKDMYDERLPLYSKWADVTIDCSNNTVEQTAQAIADAAKK